jgi:hypothetical protein
MKKLTPTLRALIVAGSLILVGTSVSGCGVLSGLTGTVQSSQGGSVSLGGELPAGWPKAVPVVDGEITFGAGSTSEKDTWVVTIKPTSPNALGDAQTQLEGAGFSLDGGVSASEGKNGAFTMTSTEYKVAVVGNGDTLVYTVTPAN